MKYYIESQVGCFSLIWGISRINHVHERVFKVDFRVSKFPSKNHRLSCKELEKLFHSNFQTLVMERLK